IRATLITDSTDGIRWTSCTSSCWCWKSSGSSGTSNDDRSARTDTTPSRSLWRPPEPAPLHYRPAATATDLRSLARLTLPVQPVHHEARAVVEEAARLGPDLSRAGDHGDLVVHPCGVRDRTGMGAHGYTPGGGRVEE